MGIQALPTSTVRTLGASQVLNRVDSVVKELIDNALDANATSIAVELSSNTLDRIQVRDNGHGVPPDDRLLVARPHCTSKIGSEDDLKDIGGSSLGFRGEALASIAEMSGSLVVSTRVEGEQVATALKINQQGEVIGQDRASLPVGTTVNITDFIKSHPVRRQGALKDTEKCLKKIKQLLQSYAFARPAVRLSLRVLKAKTDKYNWTYAPKPGGNAEDAAFKIVGAACASQCVWSVVEEQGFTFQAFLPRADAESSKISNLGAFLSVDGRPVSTARGTPKQIAKTFREELKKVSDGADGVNDPFLYLEIMCPASSYDANIEPAKDDVLFEDPDIVVGIARRLFEAMYSSLARKLPPTGPEQPESCLSPRHTVNAHEEDDNFVTALETHWSDSRSPETIPDRSSTEWLAAHGETGCDGAQRVNGSSSFRSNMYGCDEEDIEMLDHLPPSDRTEADHVELRQVSKDINLSNPWVAAKMNKSLRERTNPEKSLGVAKAQQDPDGLALALSPGRKRHVIELEAQLPTPRPSSPFSSQRLTSSQPAFARTLPGQQLLSDAALLPRPQMYSPTRQALEHDNLMSSTPGPHRRDAPAYDHSLSTHQTQASSGTPLHAIPNAALPRRSPQKRLQQSRNSALFIPPTMQQPQREERVWFDHLEDEQHQRPRANRRRPYHVCNKDGLITQGELGDLVEGPRPLTPPRRNRDMRDFVTLVEPGTDENAASLIQSRNDPMQDDLCGRTDTDELKTAGEGNEENVAPPTGLLSDQGFVPASKLLQLKSHLPAKYQGSPPKTKRCRTTESRALATTSANLTVPAKEAEGDYQLPPHGRTVSSHRRTTDGTKSRRTKSSLLPLERTPAAQRTHHLAISVSTSLRDIELIAARDSGSGFAAMLEGESMRQLVDHLHGLVVDRVSDEEMVQDLHVLVRDAFRAQKEML